VGIQEQRAESTRRRPVASQCTEPVDTANRAAGRNFHHVDWKRTVPRCVILSGLVLLAAVFARAQDPLKSDPTHFKVEFENDLVKVIRLHFDPHYKSVMNLAPARVVVVLTHAHVKVTDRDGVSAERYLKAGATFSDDGGGKGIPENLSDEPFEILWIVPKGHSNRNKR
jgi:hypothetical protein